MNFNQPLCASNYGNTGLGDCYFEPGKIKGAIQVPTNFEIALSDLATLQTFFEAKMSAAIGTRIFHYGGFETITDSTEEPTFNTTDYGYRYKTRDGYYDWTFRYFVGAVMLHQEIQKNAGSGKSFLFYDDNNVLMGYKSGQTLKGIPGVIFEALPWRPNTGADAAQYLLRYIFDPTYINKGNLGYIKQSNFNFRDLAGLQEVEGQLFSLASNVAKVQLLTKIGGINLEPVFGATLASASLFEARKRSNDASITITSVADDPTNDAYTFTFDSSTVSGMAATDAILLKGKAASVWAAATVEGYEMHEDVVIELPGS